MRSDIIPGAIFPDYELSDHTAKHLKLSELQGPHPVVLIPNKPVGLLQYVHDVLTLSLGRSE
jgi:hypothetical protein